jgi:hypothetical protein
MEMVHKVEIKLHHLELNIANKAIAFEQNKERKYGFIQ